MIILRWANSILIFPWQPGEEHVAWYLTCYETWVKMTGGSGKEYPEIL